MKGSEDLPNYYEVPIPEDKPKEEWNVDERRAYILRKIIEVGDPQMISRTKLAQLFDVSQQMISKDIKYIGKSCREHMDESQLIMEIETAFRSMKRHALQEDDWNYYRKVVNDFKNWFFQTGALQKEPERIKADQEIKITFTTTGDEGDGD